MSSRPIAIEPDEIDDLPAYQPSSSTSFPPPSHSTTPQPEAQGRMSAIAGEVASDRRYTGGDTLDEPVSTTILRDARAVVLKVREVLWPTKSFSENDAVTKDWDLWGPLVFCLVLSLLMSFGATEGQSQVVFTGIFTMVWLGEAVCTLNLKLLGGTVSFFQSVCVLGYCLFPLTIAALINVFVHTFFVRLPVIVVTYCWSAIASVSVLHGSQLEGRKWLAIYPLLLYYFVLGFTILISN